MRLAGSRGSSSSRRSPWRDNVLLVVCCTLFLVNDCLVDGGSAGSRGRNEIALGGGGFKGRRRCISYDDNLHIASGGGGGGVGTPAAGEELTELEEEDDSSMLVTEMICTEGSQFCFALWRYSANGTKEWMKQGCWETSSNTPPCQNNQCVSRQPKGKGAKSEHGGEEHHDTTTPIAGEAADHQNHQQQQQQRPPLFCCCDQDNCNLDVEVIYVDPEEDDDESSEESDGHFLGANSLVGAGGNKKLAIGLLILGGSIISGVMILATGYRYWKRLNLRQRKDGMGGGGDGEAGDDGDGDVMGLAAEGKLLLLGGSGEGESLLGDDGNSGLVNGIDLVVLLARGKFASVYEGRIPSLSDGPFALKCFAKEQKEFFENERFVFNYLGKHCTHENIIKYHGWQEFTVEPTTHLILVLDKICPGSLRDFLQSITMGAEERARAGTADQQENEQQEQAVFKVGDVLRICSGIASGLSYLHGENRDEIVIAHRDLTSKNILLDASTLTPKITDFGLSLVTRGSKYYWAGRERQAEFCSLAEAGTLRYMAPELLEGAVNLKDCENALKQADVYALALILWEVANCSQDMRLTQVTTTTASPQAQEQQQPGVPTPTSPPQPIPVNHSLPYEEEIGKDNLSMDALSRHVVQYRQRPHFRRWRDSPYTRQLRDTLIESWDAEPDARLTALCIVERLHDIRNIRIKNSDLVKGSTHQSSGQALQSPLESPTSGLFGPDGSGHIILDSPWTGRNPCLQRNLLANNTTTSTSGGTHSSEGLSTSGSMLSDTTGGGGVGLPAHPLLLHHFDLTKNQANLNFYNNYMGGSSGGTSYTGSTTGGGGASAGNVTEVSNVSSVTDERQQGGGPSSTRCPSATIPSSHHNVQPGGAPSHHNPLPPTIPFLQNLHN